MKKVFFALLLISGTAAAQEVSVGDFSGGMNTYNSPNKIPDKQASYIQNFFTDIEPLATETNGFVKKETTVLGGTNTVRGLWNFTDNTGTEWLIAFSSRSFYKSNATTGFVQFGPTAIADVFPRAAVNLGRIWFTDGSISVWSFDGASTSTISGAPSGTLISSWRNRIVISGIANSRSTIRFSADGDGTTWTLGGNPTDPFSIQLGGANDGFDTRCMWGSYNDYFIAGRKYDTYLMSGFDQSDVVLRKISSEIGCIDNNSMRAFDGSLVWLSARGVEEMQGTIIHRVSDPIRNLSDTIVKNNSTTRTVTLTTQGDFMPGTSSPLTYISYNALPGSVTLDTMTAISFPDTTESDFEAGTSTNISTTILPGSMILDITGEFPKYNKYFTNDDQTCGDALTGPYYQSMPIYGGGYYFTGATMRMFKQGAPGNAALRLMDATVSGDIGTNVLSSTTLTAASVPAAIGDVSTTLAAVYLTPGSTHWLQIYQPTGTPTTQLTWMAHSIGIGASIYGCGASGSIGDFRTYEFKGNGRIYASSGTHFGRTYDTGFTTGTWMWNWGNLNPTISTTTGTSITLETQTSADGINWDALQPGTPFSQILSTVREFIRYKATFQTTDTSTSPIFNDIAVPTSKFQRPFGQYTSPVVTIGSAITSWRPLLLSEVKTGGASIVYQFNASTSSSITSFNASSWTTVSNGIVPTNGTAPFAAFRSSFTVTSGTDTAALQDFSFIWQEGSFPAAASVVYDGRYYLSVTTTIAGTPTLDTLLVYQRNRTWTMVKGVSTSALSLWQDKMYFGNSVGNGLVYQYDVGNNYDGQPILSIIKTKSYDYGVAAHDKSFTDLFLQYDGSTAKSGSFSTTYDLDHSGSAYPLGSADISEGNGLQSVRMPFTLSNPVEGKELQYTLTKSGTGDRLKIMDFVTVFTVKDAR